jgi:hypothetical protein
MILVLPENSRLLTPKDYHRCRGLGACAGSRTPEATAVGRDRPRRCYSATCHPEDGCRWPRRMGCPSRSRSIVGCHEVGSGSDSDIGFYPAAIMGRTLAASKPAAGTELSPSGVGPAPTYRAGSAVILASHATIRSAFPRAGMLDAVPEAASRAPTTSRIGCSGSAGPDPDSCGCRMP